MLHAGEQAVSALKIAVMKSGLFMYICRAIRCEAVRATPDTVPAAPGNRFSQYGIGPIGAEIARRLRESPEVVHCIESHHGEVEQRTVHAVLAQIADSISGGRPGARRESIETYIKRLERLEEICTAHEGVEKVFAMQAGREVRVMVTPEDVDELQAQTIARDIAKQVEEELQYPGQIKISVIRETRATEYAR